ncbi:hypothetical protein BH10PSE12_BH10PSE12_36580 [soil metagenome]
MDVHETRAFELWVLQSYGAETEQVWVQNNFDGLYAAYKAGARIRCEAAPAARVVDRYEEI